MTPAAPLRRHRRRYRRPELRAHAGTGRTPGHGVRQERTAGRTHGHPRQPVWQLRPWRAVLHRARPPLPAGLADRTGHLQTLERQHGAGAGRPRTHRRRRTAAAGAALGGHTRHERPAHASGQRRCEQQGAIRTRTRVTRIERQQGRARPAGPCMRSARTSTASTNATASTASTPWCWPCPPGRRMNCWRTPNWPQAGSNASTRVQVAPCWTLMLAFPQAMQPGLSALGPQWNAARSTHHRIAWLARESSKPMRSPIERWTVQASADWSREHLQDDPARVQAKLQRAFAEVTGIRAEPSHAQVHRWLYAKTEQPLGQSHLWDGRAGARRLWRLVHRPPGRGRLRVRTGTGAGRRLIRPAVGPGAMSAAASRYIGRFAPSPDRAAACRLAGRGTRQLARCTGLERRPGRALAGADRGSRHHPLRAKARHRRSCGSCRTATWYRTRRRCTRPSDGIGMPSALTQLVGLDRAYACGCSRKDIEAALQARGIARPRHGERVYPGTCRDGLHGKPALSWRFRVAPAGPRPRTVTAAHRHTRHWLPRSAMPGSDGPTAGWAHSSRMWPTEVGDFVLQRADGPFAYQLAVVVDDAAQQVSDVVRGADLADNTARQILLQQALGLPTPRYLHTPLVLGRDGHKLSKQNGALAVDTREPLQALAAAAAALGLPAQRRARSPTRSPAGLPHGAISTIRGSEHRSHLPLRRPTTGQAPADVAHPKTIRSFVRRAGRTTAGQSRALQDLGPRFLIALPVVAGAAGGAVSAAGAWRRWRRQAPPRHGRWCWRSALAWARPARISRRCCRRPTSCAARCMNPASARCSSASASRTCTTSASWPMTRSR